MDNTLNSQFKNKKCYNIIFIGGSGVGKTSLRNRLVTKNYTANEKATVGIQTSKLNVTHKERQIILHLIDTAGQEQFKAISKQFYKESYAAIFVFSGDLNASLKEVEHYTRQFKVHYSNSKATAEFYPICLFIRNKSDLSENIFTKEHVQNVINNIGETCQQFEGYQHIKYLEASALNGDGCDDIITYILDELDKQNIFDLIDPNDTFNLYNKKKEGVKQNSNCC